MGVYFYLPPTRMKTLFALASLFSLALPLASQVIDGQFTVTSTEVACITVMGHRRAVVGVPAANIIVTTSHNHSGPGYVANYLWASELIKKLTAAAKEAAHNEWAGRDLGSAVTREAAFSMTHEQLKKRQAEKSRLQSIQPAKP